ncbi:hypothetical protein FB451DRAFT_1162057 [Mycena latifolia]|nr:hypothetical protein FB451DRAFT_1162057 [Mycena latifolia]
MSPIASLYGLPPPGPPPTCPLPPLPTQSKAVTRAQTTTVPQTPRLPDGYAFVPPSVPLTYPASYHLIAAGPMNAAPKRRVRLPKRKEPEADLADESFCCRGGAAGYDGSEMVTRFGSHFSDPLDGRSQRVLGAFYYLVLGALGFWGIIAMASITRLELGSGGYRDFVWALGADWLTFLIHVQLGYAALGSGAFRLDDIGFRGLSWHRG